MIWRVTPPAAQLAKREGKARKKVINRWNSPYPRHIESSRAINIDQEFHSLSSEI